MINLIDGGRLCRFGILDGNEICLGYRVLEGLHVKGEEKEIEELDNKIKQLFDGETGDLYYSIKESIISQGYTLENVITCDCYKISGIVHCSKFISANRRLDYSKGKKHLSDEYRLEMNEIMESLSRAKVPKNKFNPNSLYKVSLSFGLTKNLFRRDLDNMVKPVIDAMFSYIGVNDNKIVELNLSKYMITKKKNPKEFLYFEISELPLSAKSLEVPSDEFSKWLEFQGFFT